MLSNAHLVDRCIVLELEKELRVVALFVKKKKKKILVRNNNVNLCIEMYKFICSAHIFIISAQFLFPLHKTLFTFAIRLTHT